MRLLILRLLAVALMVVATACGTEEETAPGGGDPIMTAILQGWDVDTVGVVNLTEGRERNADRGLLGVETTRVFPPEADGAEVFAWEFNAVALNPVKMLILHPLNGNNDFEIIGESPMVIPRQLGANRFMLPEPIPVTFPCLLAFYMPEEGTIGYQKVRNWKMLLAEEPLKRPFISRAPFSMYGWRYGIRAFWRKKQEDPQ